MSELSIVSFGPQRTWVRPGADVKVDVEIIAAAPASADLTLRLMDLDRTVSTVRGSVALDRGPTRHRITVELPAMKRRGYGLDLRLVAAGQVVSASSAVEALEGWWQSPRHAAITEYADADATAAAVRDLARWHVTVVQHYDWMWRHYRYRPPDGASTFTDTLGRTVSHDALRAGIDAGHAMGTASLAYGSVYGAEAEHVERYPDDRVFDTQGEPLSLGGTFFINDIRPGTSWRRRLLGEYDAAVRAFGFDGIHMDSYGEPHTAVASDGEPIDFAALYPGLIAEASSPVAAARPGTRVIFNCVGGFPLEAVAATPTSCLYLELWPPDRTFSDVVRWVQRARALADDRQVVIAAYAATMVEPDIGRRQQAFEAVVLLSTVITAAGAYHHTLADGDRLLVEGYYPAAVRLHAAERRELQALWRFSARYVHLLSDPRRTMLDAADVRISDREGRPVATSSEPQEGALWVTATTSQDGTATLHIVDLRDQEDGYWDLPKRRPSRTGALRLEWSGLRSPVVASPWRLRGRATALRRESTASDAAWVLPTSRRWLMVTGSVDGK